MEYEQLKLDRQMCFPVYAASRLIIREYQPYLDKLGITYTQYLVLMVLWETDNISVHEISQKLILNTNTVTPLLKRMETLGIIKRHRSENDERKVIVGLTKEGKQIQIEASGIPKEMSLCLTSGTFKIEALIELREKLNALIKLLSEKQNNKGFNG